MKQIILRACDVCKSFANNGVQNHVLNEVSLEICRGDFTVIMGSSGSGKSTLLYALSGMDAVTAGQVFLTKRAGNDESANGSTNTVCITDMKEKQLAALRRNEFGFIFQQMHLVGNLSLFENIAVSGYLAKKESAAQTKQRTGELLEMMNLQEAAKRLPSQVSGGEQQRAAIARAVVHQPQLLFADEPTGSLNRRNTNDVLELLSRLHKKGQSILMVTHDVKAALRADRILYLCDGKILSELTLPSYEEDDVKARETRVNAWLSSMEW